MISAVPSTAASARTLKMLYSQLSLLAPAPDADGTRAVRRSQHRHDPGPRPDGQL